MFDPQPQPRVFAVPLGVDFARALVVGLDARADDLSRVTIYVNTTRMGRRLREIYDSGPARLLPRIRLITDLAPEALEAELPRPVSPLRRRLELTQVVARLLDQDDSIAPRASLYALADSLAALMDEMHGEGVSPAAISALDVTDQSGHWQRALTVLRLLEGYFDTAKEAPDTQALTRRIAEHLVTRWRDAPPRDPILIAGSTGSRGTTALLMQAVARLPQGAVILPGFDTDMPPPVWDALSDSLTGEDHPQFRFARLMQALDLTQTQIAPWAPAQPHAPARNRLVSLALRPAPVTDQWRREGPDLGDLVAATEALTLIEAPAPRAEAEAIALRLRQAARDGVKAALITPDRMLTRQVAAALDRWAIIPDDSAGVPLGLSPPGRFLRQAGALWTDALTAEALLALLKHPLCHTGHPDRGAHLILTRELELKLRRDGPMVLDGAAIRDWASRQPQSHAAQWADWLTGCMADCDRAGDLPLADHLDRHLTLAARFAAGPETAGSGALFDQAAGREAARITDLLRREADAGGTLAPGDYLTLFTGVLSDGVVRDRDAGHPDILIWGTLEARVGGADLLILGGLNDGTWPEAPAPDPWLNRVLRDQAGLLLPDRRIGLSAHDFQQAVAGKEVVLSRSLRSAEAETVPSRWINRLINLLGGLPDQGGTDALAAMRARGAALLAQAAALSVPVAEITKATRPAPCPPVEARPDRLSVTQVKTLVRDPYTIYARKVLRLEPLNALQAQADAPLRGTIYHDILETFIRSNPDARDPAALGQLLDIAADRLAAACPWPAIRLQWLSRLERIAPAFLAQEAERQARGRVLMLEALGRIAVGRTGVTLTCRADRIDETPDGRVLIYDYKTGQVPSEAQQRHFDKQLLLTAAMAERGAFDGAEWRVADAAFLGVGSDVKTVPAPLDQITPDQTWEEFQTLLARWADPARGYTARLALMSKDDHSPFDHLSRFGEWTLADAPVPEVLR